MQGVWRLVFVPTILWAMCINVVLRCVYPRKKPARQIRWIRWPTNVVSLDMTWTDDYVVNRIFGPCAKPLHLVETASCDLCKLSYLLCKKGLNHLGVAGWCFHGSEVITFHHGGGGCRPAILPIPHTTLWLWNSNGFWCSWWGFSSVHSGISVSLTNSESWKLALSLTNFILFHTSPNYVRKFVRRTELLFMHEPTNAHLRLCMFFLLLAPTRSGHSVTIFRVLHSINTRSTAEIT